MGESCAFQPPLLCFFREPFCVKKKKGHANLEMRAKCIHFGITLKGNWKPKNAWVTLGHLFDWREIATYAV